MSENKRTVRLTPDEGVLPIPSGNLPTSPLIDRVIDGRYRILKPLSTGGMGSVFLGKQLNVDRKVAIKLITSDAPNLQTRFKREAEALACVSHPAIVEIYDFISADTEGQYFLVMAYIDGIDLEEFLAIQPEGKLEMAEVLSLIIPVASALVQLHAGGIIHRDIKPSNVVRFLRADRRAGVKLVDFGIARREVDPNLTAEGVIMGTPPYLSPEVMLGKKHSKASDIYALGATMFELLTGEAPFGKRELHEVMKRTVHEPLTLPPEIVKTPVGELLKQLLDKEPDNRPSAIDALHSMERLPSRRDRPATVALRPLTGGMEPEEGGVPDASQASARILGRLNGLPSRARRLQPVIYGGIGLIVGVVLTLLIQPGRGKRSPVAPSVARSVVRDASADRAAPGPDAAVSKRRADAGQAAPAVPDAAASRAVGPDAEPTTAMGDGVSGTAMGALREPKAPPSQAEIRKRCKEGWKPQTMLNESARILDKEASDADRLEYARRILHVLVVGDCGNDQIKRLSAFHLAQLYIGKGACYAARKVWQMYLRRFKKAFPYRKTPKFPKCKLHP